MRIIQFAYGYLAYGGIINPQEKKKLMSLLMGLWIWLKENRENSEVKTNITLLIWNYKVLILADYQVIIN